MAADLCVATQIVVCPIVRESDGLALSSRNLYLNPVERSQALALSRSILEVKALIASGERRAVTLIQAARQTLAAEPQIRVDHIALVDWSTLEPLEVAAPEPSSPSPHGLALPASSTTPSSNKARQLEPSRSHIYFQLGFRVFAYNFSSALQAVLTPSSFSSRLATLVACSEYFGFANIALSFRITFAGL